MTIHERVERLRKELGQEGLAAFLVPRADEHQGEYVPPRAQRLGWISGFTGSAGLAVIAADAASTGATPSRSATRRLETCSSTTT